MRMRGSMLTGPPMKRMKISTTIILIISDIVSVVLGVLVMQQAWRAIMFDYSGWFAFVVEPVDYVKMESMQNLLE